MPADRVVGNLAVRARRVALQAQPRRYVQHDRDRERMLRTGDLNERPPVLGAHAGRVHDGEPPPREPLARDVVEHVECVRRRGEVVLVVGDQPAAEVGGQDLWRKLPEQGFRGVCAPKSLFRRHTVPHRPPTRTGRRCFGPRAPSSTLSL